MLALVILSILLTWLLCGAVCIGSGSLLLRALRFPFSPLEAFWTGLALITGILQLYHFFRPIDFIAPLLVLTLGLGGWVWNRVSLLEQLRELRTTQLAAVLLFIPVAVVIAFRAAGPCEHYDTGLYGASAIRWITTYPMVPGLANLLGQFGFHSSTFLCMALLGHGPWSGFAHHLFDSFLIAALLAAIIPAGVRIYRSVNVSAHDWFLTLLFIPAAIWASTGKIVGANTDLPNSVICLAAAAMLFRGLGEVTSEQGANDSHSMSLFVATLLFSTAVTFKISSIVFASVGWTVAGLELWLRSRREPEDKSFLAKAVIVSSLILIPWMGRGLILTGYPFFPSTALSIPVDWKVPAADAQSQADFARSFARVPELTYANARGWQWLRPWFRELVREREGFLIPLFFAMAGSIFVVLRARRKEKGDPHPRWLWVLVPSLGGLVFWFLEAPAIRFGEPVIWTAGATLGTFAALQLLDRPGETRIALCGLLLVTGWAAHPRLLWGSYFRPSLGVRTFLRLPEAKLAPHQTSSGLIINMPAETNQCWDAPLPCSPYISDRLRLRRPGELKHGFVAEISRTSSKPE